MNWVTQNPSWIVAIVICVFKYCATSFAKRKWWKHFYFWEFPRLGSEFCLIAGSLLFVAASNGASKLHSFPNPVRDAIVLTVGIVIAYIVSLRCYYKMAGKSPCRQDIGTPIYCLYLVGSELPGFLSMWFVWFVL